jgi:putative tryptophan/tyrosine transport system substrate-binding protein
MIKRREFIAGLGSAVAWPLAARAQQPQRMRRVGSLLLDAESDLVGQERVGAFRKRLEELGWIIGRNLSIDYRWAEGNVERLRTYAQELVARKPDVILAGTPAVPALQQATRMIPIVFVGGADPVAEGLVTSLARPGGERHRLLE